ncbi:MAG: hypothetical protein HC846_03145, partial [Blastocatellia bacterium]|nr:hypothetical protein [Blastocatellia bacterium]
ADLYESWGKDDLEKADRKKFDSLGGNALPGFQNRRRTLFPPVEFDANLAANALQQGNSTMIGRACASVKNGLWGLGGTERFKATNVRVVLYPATPYLEKWYQLREKKEDKKTGVFINREAQRYAMITQTNSNGEFVFSRLKPGKYFIQIIFNFTQVKSKEFTQVLLKTEMLSRIGMTTAIFSLTAKPVWKNSSKSKATERAKK